MLTLTHGGCARMIAGARRVLLAVLGFAIALTAGVAVWADVQRGAARNRLFVEGYESLSRGMGRSEVDRLLLAPAAFVCTYRGYRVHYYLRQEGTVLGLLSATRIPENMPIEVADVAHLPHIYAAVQVA